MKIGLLSITAISRSRRRSTRSGSVTPNTARQITSKVSARMRSRRTSSAPGVPAGDLALGHVADHLAERRDPRTLERRQQQLALAQVLGPVEDQHGVRTEHRLHERVGLAGAQVGLIAGEELPNRVRVGDVDAGAETA